MTEVAFWACGLFVAYAYLGYLAALWLLARTIPRPLRRVGDFTPAVSFIVTARNESARIAGKIENTLASTYPRDRFEVIVASDASDDGTDAIVERYAGRGVRLVRADRRQGKEYAQGLAITAANGEVLVFSDVATQLGPNAVANIVRNFSDETIGCVSSSDKVLDAEGRPGGEGLYVKYEMLLRRLESSIGSVVGLSGSFFAARRSVCHPWPTDLPSDFNTLLNTARKGLRGVSDAAAVGTYRDLPRPAAEYTRKVRTVARGIHAVRRNVELLNPARFGLLSWQLFSHKVCRWLVPFALLGFLATNLVLARESAFFLGAAIIHVIAYGLAAAGLTEFGRRFPPARWALYFAVVNASIMHAWYNVVRGRPAVTWEPSRR